MIVRSCALAFLCSTLGLANTSVPAAPGSGSAWRALATSELSEGARAALDALNAHALQPFDAEVSRVSGAARVLSGGRIGGSSADRSQAALDFLHENAALFALPTGFGTKVELRGDNETRAYVRYEHQGLAIDGLCATVMFDAQGVIEGAVVTAPRAAHIEGEFVIDAQAASTSAHTALAAYRARVGRTAAVEWLEPEVTRVYLARPSALLSAYRVAIGARSGAEAYASFVDAQSGAPLRLDDRVVHGTGKYPHFGQFVNFKVATASGNVFKDQHAALANKKSKRDLERWSKGVPAPVSMPKGDLVGARCDVWDANDANVFAANGKFPFLPLDPVQADAFDQVNVYYQIESFYEHLKDVLKTNLGSNFAIPLLVNYAETEPNASFNPMPFPLTQGHSEGFMVFHDLSAQLADVAADVSRDPTVDHHEYTHCWIHFEGEDFEGELDYPTRAVGEAIPDFYATTFAKDTAIGRYFAAQFLGAESMRDLHDDDHFPETVLDAMTQTASGLPEEHRSGEVFGSLLTDLRLTLGSKTTERLVFKALPFMPNDMSMLGFPTVDAGNALGATQHYFAECAYALLLSTSSVEKASGIIGAATGRGVFGVPSSEFNVAVDLESLAKRKISYPARFVTAGDAQAYLFQAKPGRKLSVTIKSKSTSGVLPDFELRSFTGLANPFEAPKPKKFSSSGHKVEQQSIKLLLPTNAIYEIVVTSVGDGLGSYTLTLDA